MYSESSAIFCLLMFGFRSHSAKNTVYYRNTLIKMFVSRQCRTQIVYYYLVYEYKKKLYLAIICFFTLIFFYSTTRFHYYPLKQLTHAFLLFEWQMFDFYDYLTI